MTSLPITIDSTAGRRTIRIELDADHLEQVAAALGLFNPDFLASLERGEEDFKAGRVRNVSSLKELLDTPDDD